MYVAHINQTNQKEQSVKEHLSNVSKMSMEYAEKISLSATGALIGLLHDIGKYTHTFNSYIHYSSLNPDDKSLRGSIDHSTAGAKYIYESFYNTKDPYQKLTAQLIALTICSHHGGLIDCLDLDIVDRFNNRMNKDIGSFYNEALYNFKSQYSEMDNINILFEKSKEEIKEILLKINEIDKSAKFGQFAAGMVVKYLFSCLIDADRYDTYLFMEDKEYKTEVDKLVLWNELADILEDKLNNFPKSSKIDLLRQEISITCRDFGQNSPGVYQLSVPTGGGKTFSSLRYALQHAKIFNKDRIFYIIPYTTIIDQNAKDIKNILGREDIILEHHSNLITDNEQEEYKLLTERWDSPIILTTMVQFLNTLFSSGTQNIRRMHNLANSVIIFDEIQSIPIKCINMFNSAMNFLSYICNATVILCTATQPLLSTTEMSLKLSDNPNIIPNMHTRFKEFRRVNLIDKRINGGYTVSTLKDFVLDKMQQVDSVLVILNTKNAVKEVFDELKKENTDLPAEKQYSLFHLSTNMCPSHRVKILEKIKEKLGKERVICISTQLIEAGVNISFECVIRSLAGLDSIAQAAGRCNRHGEKGCRDVYIVNLNGEDVNRLVDIKRGQEATERVLDEFRENPQNFENDLLSPKLMNTYYKYYFHNRKVEMNYTLPKPYNDKTMYDLLSSNKEVVLAFWSQNNYHPNLILRQAFKTAGDYFQVIDQNTTSIIVPYERGKKLITLINGTCNLNEIKEYLKEAQQFSVNLFEGDRRKLDELGAIVELKGGAVLALRDEFYQDDVGVSYRGAPMEFFNF